MKNPTSAELELDQWDDVDRDSDGLAREITVREFFAQFAWDGRAPDPEKTNAREFLEWL